MRRRYVISLLAALFALIAVPSAGAAPVPSDADWWTAGIKEADGTMLHADILRPKGLSPTAKTPVILSIGPYFNHSGQVGPAAPAEGVDYNPVGPDGPSDRFFDFVEGAKLLQRGYTYIMVDLRGFGGSTGCLDWVGAGEQADVKAAVEWTAAQPWSTGKVGMYGKSYDGVTGLVGLVSKPKGLGAVVSQEPVYDLYRYLYTNRVRYLNSLATPLLYDSIAGTPGMALGDPAYNQNALNDFSRPGCPVLNWADQQDSDHSSPYWTMRNLIPRAKGATTPLILTQGFLENNTKPDGAYDFWNNVSGFKRAWFGMWDHVRGNDTDPDTGRLLMGRAGWFDEVMRFYDRFLKGAPASQTTDKDPKIAVETSDGTWRAETSWPPSDSKGYTSTLRPGTYVDNGQNNGELADANTGLEPTGDGVWTFSRPLPYAAHLAGIPKVTLDVTAQVGSGNLVADVYDLDTANKATLISRNAYLLGGARQTVSFPLYGDDWKLPAGHRIGVLVTSSNADWWTHTPTLQTITVNGGRITLPFLATARTKTIQGGPSERLDYYKANAPFAVDPATIAASTSPTFVLPPKQK
jgi:uncharacterized protein